MSNYNKYYLMSETVKSLLFKDGKPNDEYFFYIESCPLCNSEKTKKIFSQWGIDYYRCKKCRFVYSNPRLTDKGAFIWYNSDYYNAAMAMEYFLCENVNKYYSISLNEFHFRKFIEIFKEFNFAKNIDIVDIGCGSGSILHYLRDELKYTNVVGYDLNSNNINFASRFRNIELENYDIYTLKINNKFDVIITTENIEHVSKPVEYINKIKNFIKPNGFLFLTTPHNDETATKLMGLSGDHFCAPNHQNYFNLNNLKNLLESQGLIVTKVWLDTSNQFNLYSFIKRFLIKRDQVTAFPPINANLKTIWKWQKDKTKSVVLKKYKLTKPDMIVNDIDRRINLKILIKRFLGELIPVKFTTHQIIVAKLYEKNNPHIRCRLKPIPAD